MNRKRIALVALCLMLLLTLAGCTAVNSSNSFQSTDQALTTQQGNASQQTVTQSQAADSQQPVAQEPTPTPTQDPNASGFNG